MVEKFRFRQCILNFVITILIKIYFMSIKRFILVIVIVTMAIVLPTKAHPEGVRSYGFLNSFGGRWEFQAWWKMTILIENQASSGVGDFYLFCTNTDDIMEGRLSAGVVAQRSFENRSGGVWKFNVNTAGVSGGLFAVAVDD